MKRKILILLLTLLLTLALVPSVFAQEPDEDDEISDFCLDLEAEFKHPVGEKLATAYGGDETEVDYETIMGWFCDDGFGFGEIMHALKTSAVTEEYTAQELLEMKTEMGGWGLVWQELGLIGHSDDPDATKEVGRPPHVGPPFKVDSLEQGGPPPGKGRPEWKGPPPGKATP